MSYLSNLTRFFVDSRADAGSPPWHQNRGGEFFVTIWVSVPNPGADRRIPLSTWMARCRVPVTAPTVLRFFGEWHQYHPGSSTTAAVIPFVVHEFPRVELVLSTDHAPGTLDCNSLFRFVVLSVVLNLA